MSRPLHPELEALWDEWLAIIRGPLRGRAHRADRALQRYLDRYQEIEDAERELVTAERIAERKAHNAARMRAYRATHPDYKS